MKNDIENALISGIRVDARDIVAGRAEVLTLRHVWSDGCDGRIWDGIKRVVLAHAEERAAKLGRNVEVYSRRGDRLWVAYPA